MTLLLLFAVISSVKADCIDDSQNGGAIAELIWPVVTQRADNTDYLAAERAGYKVYYIDKSDGTKCARRIPDNAVLSTVFNIHQGKPYDFWMTSIDTDGRESVDSEIVSFGIDVIPPAEPPTPPATLTPPNTITNLIITRVALDTLDYLFSFNHAKDINGVHFTDDTDVVYKLYLNDVLVNEVTIDDVPFVLTLAAGDYVAEVEVDIISIDGQSAISGRSIAELFTVEDFTPPISPPKPPASITIPVPEGYDLIINFAPKQ